MSEERTYNLSQLKFRVAKLLRKPNGGTETYDINVELPFLDSPDENADPVPVTPLTGKIQMMKADDTIEVTLQSMKLKVETDCFKCLKRFIYELEIKEAKRSFYIDPKSMQHFDDLAIDPKSMELDANELVRQEIILHFPIVLVCFAGCKGICERCGGNLNDVDCGHVSKDRTEEQRKPLSNLKEMWQNLNNQ